MTDKQDQLDYLYLDAHKFFPLSLSLSPLLLLLLDEKSRARVSRLLSSSRRCSLADLAKDWAIIKVLEASGGNVYRLIDLKF